tara:strand:+ start:115 stop:480 length:366 start_codon:yes stop_codon:yes gene_type:complete
MGISFASVQKMLIAALVITILAAFLTRDAFDTAYTAIVLTTLIAVAWGISTRETTFKHLGLNTSGILNVVAFVVVTIMFAEWCMTMWGNDSRLETYLLSLVTIGVFWWSIEMMEPTVAKEN